MRAIDLTPSTIATVDEATNLTEAARLMRTEAVGDLVITRGSGRNAEPVGVVTDRDIVIHAIACDLNPRDITVADLCTRKPATVSADSDLTEITAAMNEYGVRRVLITRDAELVGVISLDNVIEAMAEIMNNLNSLLVRQIENEQQHLVSGKSRESAA